MDDAIRKLRKQTLEYMGRLVERRKAESMRQTESGKRDPLSTVRAHSALDSAMAQAEEIISSLDRILDKHTPEVHTFRTSCNGLSRLKQARYAS
ncbi:MAG: hypothetical protein P8M22_08740 [Phycisphaerales bacterium]|nr:hypothetical protein [Phycisphaerales bacterium]